MKQKEKLLVRGFQRACILFIGVLISLNVSAQDVRRVSGTVTDVTGEAVIGATIAVKGATIGTVTDIDGNFQLEVANNAVLVISYIGYMTQEIPIGGRPVVDVLLKEDNQLLDELVVIGYGTMKKGDLTGSITAIGAKDFQKGLISNPTSLITGKVAGVQITSTGGRAGSGNQIRIRGGASLNASNDPLIVIDGMPMANGDISGVTNPLSTINPNDIESMNVLKDASATAIYGSRASNGVIIITTKKGDFGKGESGQKVRVDVSTQNSIATIARRVEVLSADQFRQVVTEQAQQRYNADKAAEYVGLLGTANTDWQKEIFRNAFTTDNNISINGAAGILPYRLSAGFISQDGILDTDNMQRGTFAVALSPTFLDKHLSVNVNLKGTYTHSRFGNGNAIGAALRMDPTKPVTTDGFNNYNGYWQWVDASGAYNTMATKNPVSLLYGKDDQSDVYRSIGNLQLDYKFHCLPELRANLNLGYDLSQGKGNVITQPWSPEYYPNGRRTQFDQKKQNLLLEFYLNYTKQLNDANRIEVMGGYTWQDWQTKDKPFDEYYFDNVTVDKEAGTIIPPHNRLISFYGRLNYNLFEKYLLTATIRRDGSSRFSPENRWGTFPSVALAWRINEEDFLKNVEILSNLKLRLGWGITGQQELNSDFGWLPVYELSDPTAQVQFGDKFYAGWRPNGYDSNRKWEQTTTKNIGLDWGFVNNRVYGSIDYYQKRTIDLLNEVPLPAGSNFTPYIVRNIGSMDNWGVEGNIGIVALETKDIQWDFGFNITYNNTEITQLSLNDSPDSDYKGAMVGGIAGGTGNTVQIHKVGYAPNSFYVYKQMYDSNGKPIEGVYEDLTKDGVINDQDLYLYHKPAPDWYMGFNTTFAYKNWMLATALRSSIGNYVYNNVNSDAGNYSQTLNPNNFLTNNVVDGLNSNFFNRQLLSDYYIQDASFLKMDYIQLGYDFGKIVQGKIGLRANFTIQNVFTLTKYEGIDPEMTNGIDNNFYPNPRTYSLGLGLNF
ncbi:MAG: TonB-dependent receptor [Dysgonamonadaceae bacterium]|jgi:iron complex outermembrane receptor protein|nr:TonB-dependent receptor [Dysgonamonadaceae bacterium]